MNELRLSTHAIDRYRRRLDAGATFEVVRSVLRCGRLETQKPWYVHHSESSERCVAWVVTRDAVFPLRLVAPGVFLAVTCLKRPRMAKAERRAIREMRREEWAA